MEYEASGKPKGYDKMTKCGDDLALCIVYAGCFIKCAISPLITKRTFISGFYGLCLKVKDH